MVILQAFRGSGMVLEKEGKFWRDLAGQPFQELGSAQFDFRKPVLVSQAHMEPSKGPLQTLPFGAMLVWGRLAKLLLET